MAKHGKNQRLFSQGDTAGSVFYIAEGKVKIKMNRNAMAYVIFAESKGQPLLGARFTADTAYEALARVQRIRSRGFQVKIVGAEGNAVSENDLRAHADGVQLLRFRPGYLGEIRGQVTK